MNKVVILGGRTGGPIIPALAMAKNVTSAEIVVFGVKNGFEQKLALEQNLAFATLPEAKLKLLTYSNSTVIEKVKYFLEFLAMLIFLIYGFSKSVILLIIIKPTLIVSTGSFLAVPVLFSNRLLQLFKLSKAKVIVHQQDPVPGISSKLTAKFGNYLSCVFDSTKLYREFSSATVIPNPFDFDSINEDSINLLETKIAAQDPSLHAFMNLTNKPLLLVFGGGSGSEFINGWVLQNRMQLELSFNILHITGSYRTKVLTSSPSYCSRDILLETMKLALYRSSVVISRCGMGSITELENLGKPAFLIPLPHSHQEFNASEVVDKFYILNQADSNSWLTTILQEYPSWFQKNTLNLPSSPQNKIKLQTYYSAINIRLSGPSY